MKKYELLEHDTKQVWSRKANADVTVYRIRSLSDFRNCTVNVGDLGGYVQSEANLSQTGDCWLFNNATATDDSHVMDNASMHANTRISDNVVMKDEAQMFDDTEARDNVILEKEALMRNNSKAYDDVRVAGNAEGHARLYEKVSIDPGAYAAGYCRISDNAHLEEGADISGNVNLYGDVVVSTKLRGQVSIDTGCIRNQLDCICLGPVGSRNEFITYNAVADKVITGCFEGSLYTFKCHVECYENIAEVRDKLLRADEYDSNEDHIKEKALMMQYKENYKQVVTFFESCRALYLSRNPEQVNEH